MDDHKNKLIRNIGIYLPEELISKSAIKQRKKNTLLIKQGESCHMLYVILEGYAQVTLNNKNKQDITISTANAGDIIGDLSTIDKNNYSASVRLLEDSTVLEIPSEIFDTMLIKHPQMMRQINFSLAKKLRNTTNILHDFVSKNVYQRIISFLLKNSHKTKSNICQLDRNYTQKEIAERIGSSREMVSRVLNTLRESGYIDVQDRIITIIKPLPSYDSD